MLHIEPRFYLFIALLLLVLPLPWLLAAFLAALIHELCHLTMVVLLKGTVRHIRVDIGGAQIGARLPGWMEEFLSSLAGPVGSLLLVLLCHRLPRLAVCGCIQGLYNLLPIYPLDGGRALRCLLERICPTKAETILSFAEKTVAGLLLMAAVYGAAVLSLGFWPVLAVLVPISGLIRRKIPCKQREIGVQ